MSLLSTVCVFYRHYKNLLPWGEYSHKQKLCAPYPKVIFARFIYLLKFVQSVLRWVTVPDGKKGSASSGTCGSHLHPFKIAHPATNPAGDVPSQIDVSPRHRSRLPGDCFGETN